MRSPTPRLDAVLAWIAAGRVGDITCPNLRADPPEWDDYGRRIEASLRMAASGAQAEPPQRQVTEVRTGRLLPAPPKRRTRQ